VTETSGRARAEGPRAEAAPEADPYVRLARARLGRVVRRNWRLDALLGVGGMAAVYAATHRNGSRAAIKMLHPLVATDEARRRFLREGYLASSVQHPGVVQVRGDDEAEDGSMFLVMELLQGESLESYAGRRIHLPAAEALAVAEQILDVLVAAHARKIVHRDVKPENVYLCADGRVKLLDFGIARLHEVSRSSVATHHGFLLGTPTYMAPEQARGDWEVVDGRTDVWSVGATLFRVLTGRTVHQGNSHVELLIAASGTPAPRVREVQASVPELVAALVDRALAFDVSERWSSSAEMLESVRSVHQAMGYPASSKLRVKIASDTTQRVELPEPPQASEEFDRAQVLDGLPRFDDDELPTAVAAIDPAQRAALRGLRLGGAPEGSIDVELEEGLDAASPSRSGIQGAGVVGREMASIFDETGERTGAMAQPPRHLEDPPTVRDAAPRRGGDRPLAIAWAVSGLSVAAFLAALVWRLLP